MEYGSSEKSFIPGKEPAEDVGASIEGIEWASRALMKGVQREGGCQATGATMIVGDAIVSVIGVNQTFRKGARSQPEDGR